MNEFRQAKEAYDSTPVPAELSQRVQAGIREGKARRRSRRSRTAHRWIAAAACFALVLAGLNLSPVIASAAANVPVLGGLFRVLTFVDYSKSEDRINYDVSAPKVEADSALAQRVNAAIQEKMDRHLAKARQDWDNYRDAFFATGGTQDQWDSREMDVIIRYEIKSQTDERVSFVVSFAEGWVSSYEERYYYNLNLAENQELTLRDLLGEDWAETCNAAIQQQMDERVDGGSTEFFPPEKGGFTSVDETTSFYIREDGAVVVCFPPYSIAAGSAGNLEFVVQAPEG